MQENPFTREQKNILKRAGHLRARPSSLWSFVLTSCCSSNIVRGPRAFETQL